MSLYRTLATSQHPLARWLRAARRGVLDFSLPAPKLIFVPLLWFFTSLRQVYYFVMRVFVCEPLFKAACKQYGRNVHTDVYIHWIQGKGDIILGDDVLFDGKSSIKFAARYSARPTLRVGSHTGFSSGCDLTIGKSITVGRYCRIAANVSIRDSNGHPSDPEARRAGMPPEADEVQPVVIEDNVWVGSRAIISPGVTLGEGSVIAAGAVVLSSVPAYSVVAGNPARRIGSLEPPQSDHAQAQNGASKQSVVRTGTGEMVHE